MVSVGIGDVMFRQVNYYWRIAATGTSFFVFGIGGLFLRIAVFPLLNILLLPPHLRIMLARHVVRFTFRGFVELMRFLGVLSYDIQGLQRLNRNGLLILANHPTLIDTVFLMAFIKQADCIVKNALLSNPFTRGPVRAAGYISNKYGPELMDDCITSLRNGNNLIIFPEGTRTSRPGLMIFRRGAANIAIRGMHNITPVIIRCTPPTLGKGEKWWQVPPTRAHFNIEVKEDIDIRTFLANTSNESLAARHLTEYLQNYFIKENQHHAAT